MVFLEQLYFRDSTFFMLASLLYVESDFFYLCLIIYCDNKERNLLQEQGVQMLSKAVVLGVFTKVILGLFFLTTSLVAAKKETIQALYIPLADHYAAIVAYERYGKSMKFADFKIEQMKNWDLLRAYFQAGKADMAFVMSPLVMDMYRENPHFNWIGLMHRDGSALAINDYFDIKLPNNRKDRKPNSELAQKLNEVYKKENRTTYVGMPHILSTHSVVLFRYLKEHGSDISFSPSKEAPVRAFSLAPPKAPGYIKSQGQRHRAAAFEQSLPWADVVETGGFGKVVWYSKDVMPYKHGHVECITVATKWTILAKRKALKEVNYFIHKAGQDIEKARLKGGQELKAIVNIIRKHIKAHTQEAIVASLNPQLRVINYECLNVDKSGLKMIMDYAVQGGILSEGIDIDAFSDESFHVNLGKQ